jgi:UDP-N-acetylglucosamine--N-acetylmuramyl-(pentapeptide) pyrophosphoryl-undecaprenol N-acetylglucosamine transferase
MNNKMNIIIAGGKTGGHLFPGIAIAKALEQIIELTEYDIHILFIGTNALFEIQTLKKYGYEHKAILSKPIKGKNIGSKFFSASIIIVSLLQSMIIIKNFKPDFVLGVGGFSSFAVIVAAWVFGIPNAIQEQNAFPGMTNRILSKITKTIFTSFKNTKGFIDNPRVKYFGNPVRKTDNEKISKGLNIKNYCPDKFTILVTGGSQGAYSINNSFIEAMALMQNDKSNSDHLHPDKFNIIHQTGVNDEALMKKKYQNLKINATVRAFFHDMPQLQTKADLIITRAGAGIIAEICIKGLPAIFIPFPHAADDHQKFNAKALEKLGAAIVIEDKNLTGQILKQRMEKLIKDKKKLVRMGRSLKQAAMPDADKKIASYILNIISVRDDSHLTLEKG